MYKEDSTLLRKIKSRSELVKFSIENSIIKDEFKTGNKLPSIVEISNFYKIGKSTSQKIITELYNEGYILKKRNLGFFVKPYAKEKLITKHQKELEELILCCVRYGKTQNICTNELNRLFILCIKENI